MNGRIICVAADFTIDLTVKKQNGASNVMKFPFCAMYRRAVPLGMAFINILFQLLQVSPSYRLTGKGKDALYNCQTYLY